MKDLPSVPVTASRTRPLVGPDPWSEVWRLLRLNLDEGLVGERIRAIHELPPGAQESNVRKQAEQVGYSVRQAEEYFSAASRASIATKPLLLYYGAVSLGRALILVRLDGAHSYDALRASRRHRHHGLDVFGPESVSPMAGLSDWLSSVGCRCHVRGDPPEPWGNFALFHRALMAPAVRMRFMIRDVGAPTSSTHDMVLAGVDKLPLDALAGRAVDLLTLLRQMPDLWTDLVELELEPAVCPGRIEALSTRTLADGAAETEVLKEDQLFSFFVVGVNDNQRDAFRALTEVEPRLEIYSEAGNALAMRMRHVIDYATGAGVDEPLYFPDVVESLAGRTCFVVDPGSFIGEPSGQLMTLFTLGMLSRYYPDIWMRVVGRNVALAELLGNVLNVIALKFPLLMLDQITGVKHTLPIDGLT